MTTPGLKEWSAAVHALLSGRQQILLRKGGIGEKRFSIPDGVARSEPFVLFPTVAHSHAERVRPEHRDLLAPAAADVEDDAVVIRAAARVVAAIEVRRPERIAELEPWHIWTTASIQADRLDFRPKRRLAVLVVATCRLPPRRLPRLASYAGCTSWVDLPDLPDLPNQALDDVGPGEPVRQPLALDEVAAEVRARVG
ncbi:MAG: DUF1802 family protein [Nocardioides sp.]|uniref:DUF1802 family protein n=1 Tax=Nocardioides sp. TaxID=35761 RepID=UPI0039E4F2B1